MQELKIFANPDEAENQCQESYVSSFAFITMIGQWSTLSDKYY